MAYLPSSNAITIEIIKYGSRSANSFSPNKIDELAESQVESGGLAQKGIP